MALLKYPAVAICVLFFSIDAVAQEPSEIDSLKKSLQRHSAKDSIRVDLLNQLAFDHYLTDPQAAMQYSYEAVALAKDISYRQGEAQGLRQVGIVLWTQANYGTALKNFVTGLKAAEMVGNAQLIADLHGNIGLVYHGLGDYEEALRYHQQSLAMQRSLQNKTREAVALNNIGDVLRQSKDFDRAIDYYSQALKLRAETNNRNGVATNVRNIGNVYEDQGLFKKALGKYLESLVIAETLHGKAQCNYSIGSVYFKLKQYRAARQYALESLQMSNQGKFRGFIRDVNLLLSSISEAQHDTRDAFAFYKQYAAYKDSVLNLQVASEIAYSRLEYELGKKQNEIDLLRKDADLQQSTLARKNTLLVSGALTLVLLTSLAIILYKSYYKERSANSLLGKKNTEIARQHAELCAQRDELMTLNEEITAQQEEICASRDALAEKNASIARMNEQILLVNQNLEKLVADRTATLEKQNKHLIEYAFINAHKVRGPLARVMGLANLLALAPCSAEQQRILQLLDEATAELDNITRSITVVVQNGIDAYEFKDQA
jgi:tetratricopeptide (TPR) repeat protein